MSSECEVKAKYKWCAMGTIDDDNRNDQLKINKHFSSYIDIA